MANDPILPQAEYAKLLADAQAILHKANRALAEAYWNLGKRLDQALGEDHGVYGEATILRLADDLGTDRRNLDRARVFCRKFKKEELAPGLGWTHYLALMSLPRDQAVAMAKKVKDDTLSARETRREVAQARDLERFRGMPERRVAVSIDRLFNRLYSIPDPEDLVRDFKGARIEKTYYDRLSAKLKQASERIKELRRFLKSELTPVPDKEELEKGASEAGKKNKKDG